MRRDGIVHAGLARRLAALRHTQTFVIADAGLPLPGSVPVVDLGYRYGMPPFDDVTVAVLREVVIEASWVSRDIVEANPGTWRFLRDTGLRPDPLEHEEFKRRCAAATFAVRTGEATLFANVLCRAGVAFGD